MLTLLIGGIRCRRLRRRCRPYFEDLAVVSVAVENLKKKFDLIFNLIQGPISFSNCT